MQQPVGSTTLYMDKTGNIIYDDLYNNVTIHSFDLDIANNKTENVTILSPKLNKKLKPFLKAREVRRLLFNNSLP